MGALMLHSLTMSAPKKQKTGSYILHYWQGLPGRGEFIRLSFEYTNTPYDEATNNMTLLPTITDVSKVGFPPHFAPPCLELPNGKYLSQTPAILDYLALKLGLDGSGSVVASVEEEDVEEEKVLLRAQVNQLVLIALDLNNESHDVHHPIDSGLYYEDQKEESSRRAESFRASRIPKFLSYFQKVLVNNPKNEGASGGPYLITNTTTTADLVLFHIISGLEFAFPKRTNALKESGNYDLVFKLYERVKAEPSIKAYLNSSRRQTFGTGIFRNYPELDGDE